MPGWIIIPPGRPLSTVRASGVRRRPSVACTQIWQCAYVYPRALLLAHWQRTHRASDCGVISGQVMLSQLGLGGTRRWAAGFPSINRSILIRPSSYEVHTKVTQTSDLETKAIAPKISGKSPAAPMSGSFGVQWEGAAAASESGYSS